MKLHERFSLTTISCRHSDHEKCPGSFVLSTPPMEGRWVCACLCHNGWRSGVVMVEQ